MDKVEKELYNDMINIYRKADRECNYRATRFLQMIDRKGPLVTAKVLISKDGGTEGFTKLWEYGRLDLSLEALVIGGKYDSFFTNEEINMCKSRLKQFGYDV